MTWASEHQLRQGGTAYNAMDGPRGDQVDSPGGLPLGGGTIIYYDRPSFQAPIHCTHFHCLQYGNVVGTTLDGAWERSREYNKGAHYLADPFSVLLL